jgi:hypothetical protein
MTIFPASASSNKVFALWGNLLRSRRSTRPIVSVTYPSLTRKSQGIVFKLLKEMGFVVLGKLREGIFKTLILDRF